MPARRVGVIVDMRACAGPGCGVLFPRTARDCRRGERFCRRPACQAQKQAPRPRAVWQAMARQSAVVRVRKRDAAIATEIAGLDKRAIYDLALARGYDQGKRERGVRPLQKGSETDVTSTSGCASS